MCAKLLLPLGEVGTFDWRHCVSLLPFGEVVVISFREKAHHLSLHGENIAADEGCAHLRLVDVVGG